MTENTKVTVVGVFILLTVSAITAWKVYFPSTKIFPGPAYVSYNYKWNGHERRNMVFACDSGVTVSKPEHGSGTVLFFINQNGQPDNVLVSGDYSIVSDPSLQHATPLCFSSGNCSLSYSNGQPIKIGDVVIWDQGQPDQSELILSKSGFAPVPCGG